MSAHIVKALDPARHDKRMFQQRMRRYRARGIEATERFRARADAWFDLAERIRALATVLDR